MTGTSKRLRELGVVRGRRGRRTNLHGLRDGRQLLGGPFWTVYGALVGRQPFLDGEFLGFFSAYTVQSFMAGVFNSKILMPTCQAQGAPSRNREHQSGLDQKFPTLRGNSVI